MPVPLVEARTLAGLCQSWEADARMLGERRPQPYEDEKCTLERCARELRLIIHRAESEGSAPSPELVGIVRRQLVAMLRDAPAEASLIARAVEAWLEREVTPLCLDLDSPGDRRMLALLLVRAGFAVEPK